MKSFVAYFYDELYQPDYTLPENLTAAAAAEILRAYLAVYDHADDKDTWFARIKALCAPLGYTPNVKEYKKTRRPSRAMWEMYPPSSASR